MKALFIGSILAAVVALVAAMSTFPVEGSYASRSKLIQRVQKSDADALFGEGGTQVGSPQELIIEDSKAFTGAEENGAALVDEGYLTSHQIYPLQLRTVRYVSRMVRLCAGAAIVVALLLAWIAKKRLRVAA